MGVGTAITAGYSEIIGTLPGSGFASAYQEDAVADLYAMALSGGNFKVPGATTDNLVCPSVVKGPAGNDFTIQADSSQKVVIGGDGVLETVTLNVDSLDRPDSGTFALGGTNATAVTVGNATATATITGAGISLAGGSSEIDLTTTGALDLNSGAFTLDCSTAAITPTSTFDIQATGAITVDSSGGTIGIGTDADTGAVSIATAGARAVSIGSASATSATITAAGINLAGGSSEIDLTTTGAIDLNGGTFTLDTTTTMALNAGSTMDLDAAGAVSINSSGGVINVGNDDVDQAINIGTTGERTISIGNTVGAANVQIYAATGQLVQINGDAKITGDLEVLGTTTTVETQTLQVQDNYVYLNDGYEATTALPGGLTVNYKAEASPATINVATGGFVAGIPATSNPYVTTDTASGLSAGDLIQVHNANNAANDGIYEVLTHAANVITIRGVGTSATTQNFPKNQFVADATVQGTIRKVNVSVIDINSSGDWQVAKGTTTSGWTYTTLSTGNPSLSSVLTTGNTTGGHDISISTGDAVSGAAELTLEALGGTMDLDATGAVSINSSGAAINIGNDVVAQAINVGTAGARAITVGSSSASTLSLAANGEVDITGGGALDVNMTAGVTIDCTTMALTPTSTFDLQASGAVTIDSSGGAISIGGDANAQAINVGTGGAARTITIGNLTTTTSVNINTGTNGFNVNANGASLFGVSGTLDVDSTGALSLNSSGAAINIGNDAVAQAINMGTGAAARVITIGNNTSTTTLALETGSGGLQVDADGTSAIAVAGTITIDATGELELNSSGGAINIGNDAVAQAINVGTGAAARTIIIGNGSGATDVTITAGTGGIDIGVGTAAMTINLGTGGTGAKTVVIGDDTVTGSTTTIKSGATGDITFDARGMVTPITLNDATDKDLSGFTATSIVGALNELKGGSGQVVSIYTTTGLTVGAPVYISGADVVSHGDADAVASSRIIGLVKTVGGAGVGEVVVKGKATGVFAAGDSGFAVNDPVYLSLTTGRLTFTPPSASGDTIIRVGYLTNTTGLNSPTQDGDTATIEVMVGEPIEIG